MYREIEGDLIVLAKNGEFEVITHGANCWCTMGAGIAPLMAAAFGADKFEMEGHGWKGDINKLGTIDYELRILNKGRVYHPKAVPKPKGKNLIIVNSYTQYGFGRNHKDGSTIPLNYEALTLCLRKINHVFAGKKIGIPQIGAGLGGGNWTVIKNIIQTELIDCEATVVIYKPELIKQ